MQLLNLGSESLLGGFALAAEANKAVASVILQIPLLGFDLQLRLDVCAGILTKLESWSSSKRLYPYLRDS
jgi:hypothetical protein